jgi:hypothetical protein
MADMVEVPVDESGNGQPARGLRVESLPRVSRSDRRRSAASISKHASREVLGERSGFLGCLESDAHHDAARQVKLDASKRVKSSHCRMLRMGVLTSSVGTGTSTVTTASLLLSGGSARNPSYGENRLSQPSAPKR